VLRVLKNILTVLSGSLAGQLLALAALPILSRIYHAEAFGKFQFYLSCLNVLLMFAAFRYEMALLSVEEGSPYANLLRAILRILLAVSFVVAMLVTAAWFFDFAFLSGTTVVFWLLVPATFIGGVFQTLTFLPMRYKAYALSARSKIVQSFAYVLTAISLSWTPIANESLIVADILARGAGAIAILKGFPGTLGRTSGGQTMTEFRETTRNFNRFPLYSFPGTVISALTATIMPLVFARIFGFEIAGQYALVDRFVLMPVGVVAGASMQVFTGEFSANVREHPEGLNATYRRIVRNLFLIAIGPCILGMVLAPTLIPIIFGEQWVLAGRLCAIAMPIALVNFVVVPVNMAIILCGRQRVQFGWELFRCSMLATSLLPLLWFKDISPEKMMTVYSAVLAIVYLSFIVLADRVTRQPVLHTEFKVN
jgi:O-antigen/teichoic acid export membrane protein